MFITNLTGIATTGTYSQGYPLGVKNNHGVVGGPFSPTTGEDGSARLAVYDTIQTETPSVSISIGDTSGLVPSKYPFSGGPPDYIPTVVAGTGTSSNSANSVETSVEVIRELNYKQSVRDGEWNQFSGKFGTPLGTADTGCWNIGNSSEASPYIETINCDNGISVENNFITFAIGGIPGPVVINEGDETLPTYQCPCHVRRPESAWGYNVPPPPNTPDLENYPFKIKDGDDCQGARTYENRDKRIYFFSGEYNGLTGVFTLSSEPFNGLRSWYPRWVSDVRAELFPGESCAVQLINKIGANCTYVHSKVSYRGAGVDDVGVSGTNWKGWCDKEYDYKDKFFEARECPGVTGLDHLYACGDCIVDHSLPGGGICDLTPLYRYTVEDSCDCLAVYNNGRWSHNLGGPFDGPWLGKPHNNWTVDDAEPDWNASNNGTGPLSGNGPLTNLYRTGDGCFLNVGFAGSVGQYPGLAESNYVVIVATGGGGPGAGDNIPPYWSDAECDWMYAVQQMFSDASCTGAGAIFGNDNQGCPSGPITTVKLSQLYAPAPSPFKMDWSCCLSGSAAAVGCPSTPALFDVGDYVNIADYQLNGYHKIGYSFDNGFAIDLSLSGAGALSNNPFSTGCESELAANKMCMWYFSTNGNPDDMGYGTWTLTDTNDCCDCSGASPDPNYFGLTNEGSGVPCTAASGSDILSNSWQVVGRTSGNADSNPDSLDCTWGYQIQFDGCAATGLDGSIAQNLLTGVVPYPATAYIPESYLTSGTTCL